MNMLVKSAEVEHRGPLIRNGSRQSTICTNIDDWWILQGLEMIMTWTGMKFKSTKSRSLLLKRGIVIERFRFKSEGTIMTLMKKENT